MCALPISERKLGGPSLRSGGHPFSGSSTRISVAVLRQSTSPKTRPLPYLVLLSSAGIPIADIWTKEPPQPELTKVYLSAPCGNPACNDYDPPVPRPVKVATSVEWVVISCPACGFTYGQRSSQTTQTKRIFRYGPVWEARLRELIAEGTAKIGRASCRERVCQYS